MNRRTVTFVCEAPDKLFTATWDELSWEWQDIIESQDGLNCDGGGVPGSWCRGCYWFGGEEEEY